MPSLVLRAFRLLPVAPSMLAHYLLLLPHRMQMASSLLDLLHLILVSLSPCSLALLSSYFLVGLQLLCHCCTTTSLLLPRFSLVINASPSVVRRVSYAILYASNIAKTQGACTGISRTTPLQFHIRGIGDIGRWG